MPRLKKEIRDYFRKIGRKGGRAGKGQLWRKEINTRAAEIRWRKLHPKPAPIRAEETG